MKESRKLSKRKVLVYHGTNKLQEKELEIDTTKRIDNMYYKTNLGMIPVAYLYDPSFKEEVQVIVDSLEAKRQELLQLEGRMFNIELPKYRLKRR